MHTRNERFTLFNGILLEMKALITEYQSLCDSYGKYDRIYQVIEALIDKYNSNNHLYKFSVSLIKDKCSVENLELTFYYCMSYYSPNIGFKKEFEAEINIKEIVRKARLKEMFRLLEE